MKTLWAPLPPGSFGITEFPKVTAAMTFCSPSSVVTTLGYEVEFVRDCDPPRLTGETSLSSVEEAFWQSAWLFIFKFMFCCKNCQLCFQSKMHAK